MSKPCSNTWVIDTNNLYIMSQKCDLSEKWLWITTRCWVYILKATFMTYLIFFWIYIFRISQGNIFLNNNFLMIQLLEFLRSIHLWFEVNEDEIFVVVTKKEKNVRWKTIYNLSEFIMWLLIWINEATGSQNNNIIMRKMGCSLLEEVLRFIINLKFVALTPQPYH